MSIVKRNDNWGYSSDYSKSNWTGRVPRQARITGQWSTDRKPFMPVGDVVATGLGALALLVVLFV